MSQTGTKDSRTDVPLTHLGNRWAGIFSPGWSYQPGLKHYYKNKFAQRCDNALRGRLLFLPAAVNPTIYRGGHFLFAEADTFARHGKSIYRGGPLNMPAMENRYFP